MTDRGIIMQPESVRALLAGRKTQTRRVLKLPKKTFSGGPIYERKDMGGWEPTTLGGGGAFTVTREGSRTPAPEKIGIWHRTTGVCLSAPYQPGDRLWVREAWHGDIAFDNLVPSKLDTDTPIWYTADQTDLGLALKGKRRPGMFLPRWASRLTLTVIEVRVQRLQEIGETDAIAEGLFMLPAGAHCDCDTWWVSEAAMDEAGSAGWATAREAYANLWDSINAARAPWASNPFVVALTFAVHHHNIDRLPL